MKKILLALLIIFSYNSHADTWTTTNDGGGQIVLTQTVCSQNKNTSVVFSQLNNAKTMFGCWFVTDGFVMVTWSDGDIRSYPIEIFTLKQGTSK